MCGIVSIVSRSDNYDFNNRYMRLGLNLLRNRGPESKFSYVNEKLAIGQTVLAFTRSHHNDSEHLSPSKNYVVVMNGEIYNWKDLANEYLSGQLVTSDINLIASLVDQGKPIEQHNFRGMFVILILNLKNDSITIITDKLSEKSCFYYFDHKYFVVSSEIKPLVDTFNLQLNSELARSYFESRNYSPSNRTIYNNVYKTESDQVIRFSRRSWKFSIQSRGSIRKMIDHEYGVYLSKLNATSMYREAEAVYTKAADEISTASVRQSVVVSGGVDSSTASHFLTKSIPTITKVALKFPTKDEQAQMFVEKTNVNVNILDVSVDNYLDALGRSYQIAQQPLPTHSFASQLIISDYIKDYSKTLFTGDVGDELLGGYDAYSSLSNVNALNHFRSNSPYAIVTGEDPSESKTRWDHCMDSYESYSDDEERILSATLLNDLLTNGVSVGLLCSDLATSSVGVESRAFYANEHILRFALNLPIELKMIVSGKSSENRTFARSFFQSIYGFPPFSKQGFSGYPDAGFVLLDNSYQKVSKILLNFFEIDIDKKNFRTDNRYRWKCLNLALFISLTGRT